MERQLEIHINTSILWHLQNLVKNCTMKSLGGVLPEIDKTFENYPQKEELRIEFVKIIFKEFEVQINKGKESARINLLKPYLSKVMESPYFLSSHVFSLFSGLKDPFEMYNTLSRHIKQSEQLIFALGVYKFYMQSNESKSIKLLKTKIKEWFEFEKDGKIPTYAVHALLTAIKDEPELRTAPINADNIREFIRKQNSKACKEEPLHPVKINSIFDCNRTTSFYKNECDSNNYKGHIDSKGNKSGSNSNNYKFVEK